VLIFKKRNIFNNKKKYIVINNKANCRISISFSNVLIICVQIEILLFFRCTVTYRRYSMKKDRIYLNPVSGRTIRATITSTDIGHSTLISSIIIQLKYFISHTAFAYWLLSLLGRSESGSSTPVVIADRSNRHTHISSHLIISDHITNRHKSYLILPSPIDCYHS